MFVERSKRTQSDLIEEPIYFEGKACWLDHLCAAMEKYTNCVHGTHKMTPFEISTNNNFNNAAKLATHTKGFSRTEGSSHIKINKIAQISSGRVGKSSR